MHNAEITGWGKCMPPARLTNHDLSTFLDTSDEWISSRTGIKERCVSHVDIAELAATAGLQALAAAGLTADQLDAIILCTCTPGTSVPSSASRVQQILKADQAAVFDMNAACSGFVYGMQTASALIQTGAMKRILLIGAERLTQLLDWTKRDTAVLFGDGAGAVILETNDDAEKVGFLAAKLGCDSEKREILFISDFGTNRKRFSGVDTLYNFQFEGPEIFKRAVKGMGEAATNVLAQANIANNEVDFIVPHQANLRIIDALAKRIDAPYDNIMVNIEKYGNTSAATVPVALCEALEEGRIKPGDNVLLAAFGAGLTWGAAAIRWGKRVTPINQSDASLSPCDKTALEILAPAIKGCQEARKAEAEA
ncbi:MULTISPECIES: ketoacyl-ACP synthase III [unclassified Agarivorans]|uniref:ketoacyl-ACP synthase III n=1 Tax=unclassified Agarivorans TaxID=2636026 RepID=UPI0026E20B36|nr:MULTISPECIES: ketoacyl-ACP synthase III [unclassified Agarivorans]MDO6687183.1 ketoacyl-ACP synthase III [Agarivorans sp. 3_MG-2023]MDO6716890.1 ketoacyl-ACP synthase III [Agarivorans sp. 2_MG-2023]